MKWNDSCILLFWDMLTLATYYLNYGCFTKENSENSTSSKSSYSAHVIGGIELEYIAVFLFLHVSDAQQRPSSPIVAYDTVWPANNNIPTDNSNEVKLTETYPISPGSSPPSSHNSKHQKYKHGNVVSVAVSPKSPKTPILTSPGGASGYYYRCICAT
jgi:hypothetical protein